jgi:hypothetical protein
MTSWKTTTTKKKLRKQKMISDKSKLLAVLIGFLIGGVAIASYDRNVAFKGYYQVQEVNIGGFLIKGGKIYSLTELLHDEGELRKVTK